MLRSVEELKDRYKGMTAWIVGKGPSLQYLKKEDIGAGPVITINSAITAVESLGFENPLFSMQKDGGGKRQYANPSDVLLPDCDYAGSCGDRSISAANHHQPMYNDAAIAMVRSPRRSGRGSRTSAATW